MGKRSEGWHVWVRVGMCGQKKWGLACEGWYVWVEEVRVGM